MNKNIEIVNLYKMKTNGKFAANNLRLNLHEASWLIWQ